MSNIAVVGPVFPYRAGIAYCTTRLAEELAKSHDVRVHSFRRQFPKRFYPGKDDIDETLRDRTPEGARFALDIVKPISWIREGLAIRRERPDVVIFVWWIWVWALPYLVMLAFIPRSARIVAQCHNATDKEPSWWKTLLNRAFLGRADALVVHAESEREALVGLLGASRAARITRAFLPVHELGGAVPTRSDAKRTLGLEGRDVALFFGHVRPFKGLDIALDAWARLRSDALLLVAGEVWWNDEERYREQAKRLGIEDRVRFEFRFIPDSEVATYFAAADVVVAPYRSEAQSGVALTAFHFARPVIATHVGGIPEIIEEGRNGLLVAPENPAALASAVDRFFAMRPRVPMEAAAAESARKYSWDEYGLAVGRTIESSKFEVRSSKK
ncbi:MAG: glycosyltransferase [Thermoanaerobaculia bacterium]